MLRTIIFNFSRISIVKMEGSMAIVVAEKIIEMVFIMLCGIVLYKTGLIDDKTVPRLSNILLMLVSPLMIFQSY